ncbi:MAG TPA: glycosyltransferase, partial [Candidatus Dojkabacteria bacterium]|nr:glycosyltransferase [Candidatus Dojkabacteria bacterium]
FIKKTSFRNFFRSKYPKKVLLVYVAEAFQTRKDSAKFRSHTNRWRNLAIAEVFHKKGYQVDVLDYRDVSKARKIGRTYDLLLGMGEAFDYLCVNKASQFKKKVYLGTGTYWEFQNKQEESRIEQINSKYNANLKPNRLAYNDPKMWGHIDAIAVLASPFVAETYRKAFKGPIFRFYNHGYDDYDFFVKDKDFEKVRNRFIYISGLGFALNGLDLIIEAFSKFPQLHLDIYGPLDGEKEFLDTLGNILNVSPNIKLKGWVDVCSEDYREIVKNHAAIINSIAINACETHGTVVVGMNHGLIPVVTQGGDTALKELGFIINPISYDGVVNALQSYIKTDAEDLRLKSINTYRYARENYSQAAFVKRFEEIISEIEDL